MKKLLLSALVAMAAITSYAGIDPAEYPTVDGVTCKNLWLKSEFTDTDGWKSLPIEGTNYARTATILGDKVYIAQSKEKDEYGSLADRGSLIELDLYTGEYIRTIRLSVNGERLSGLLCVNQIGVDDYGNLWVAGFVANTIYNGEAKPVRPYVVDVESGACTLVGELTLPEDESEAAGRVDYFDCVGDITGEKNRCVFMTAVSGGDDLYVYGWQREQGGDWMPLMNEGAYVAGIMCESYPADQSTWGNAAFVHIVRDEDHSANFFYVDGFTTFPTLYDNVGNLVDSFESVYELAPRLGCNGVCEFLVGNNKYLAYVIGQYDGENSCQINVCKFDESWSMESLELCYTLPKNGLGQRSDGGNRIHSITTKKVVDENGKEGVYLLTYKGANGVGVYLIAEDGFNDGNGEPQPEPVNEFSSADVTAIAGEEFALPVCLTNDNTLAAYQCDVVLPAGFEINSIDQTNRNTYSHSLNYNVIGGNTVRLLCYSGSAENLLGNEGELFRLNLQAPEEGGVYEIEFRNIVLSDLNGTQFKPEAFKVAVNVEKPAIVMGDVNGDGRLSIGDVVWVCNYILDEPDEGFNAAVADMNGDGDINVTDIVLIVNAIVNGTTNGGTRIAAEAETSETTSLSVPSFAVRENLTAEVEIELQNMDYAVTGMQFSIELPEGLAVEEISLADRAQNAHHIATAEVDGRLNVVTFSTLSENFAGTSGAVLTMKVKADSNFIGGDIALRNIFVSEPDGTEHALTATTTNVTMPTGILGIGADNEAPVYYNLQGIRLGAERPSEGLYIEQRGTHAEKVIVK